MGFCNIGADGSTMNICSSLLHLFGQTSFNLAFCSYLHHQFFNWASVPGGRFSNSPTSQSPVRCLLCRRRFRHLTQFSLTKSLTIIVVFLDNLTSTHHFKNHFKKTFLNYEPFQEKRTATC